MFGFEMKTDSQSVLQSFSQLASCGVRVERNKQEIV